MKHVIRYWNDGGIQPDSESHRWLYACLLYPGTAFPTPLNPNFSNSATVFDNKVYDKVKRLVFTVAGFLSAGRFNYRVELLAVFGDSYTRGSLVLAVFVLSRVVSNGAGAIGWLLLMTDHQYLDMVNSWMLGVLNIALSYYFVLRFGLIGAALGTGSSLAFVNLLRLGQLRYLEGLWPYDRTYLKPVAALVPASGVMALTRPMFPPSVGILAGMALGGAVFAGGLLALGVERRDRELVAALAVRYRGTV